MAIHIDLDNNTTATVERQDDGHGLYLTLTLHTGDILVNHRALEADVDALELTDREVIHKGKVALLRDTVDFPLDAEQARDLAGVLTHIADELDR